MYFTKATLKFAFIVCYKMRETEMTYLPSVFAQDIATLVRNKGKIERKLRYRGNSLMNCAEEIRKVREVISNWNHLSKSPNWKFEENDQEGFILKFQDEVLPPLT